MTSLLIYWIGLPLTVILLSAIPAEEKNAQLSRIADNYVKRVPITEESETREVVRVVYSDLSKFCNQVFTRSLDICWNGKSKKTLIGICYPLPTRLGRDKYRMAIEIDQKMKTVPYVYLEEVIWHEMAHCLHGIGHSEELLLMNAWGMNADNLHQLRRMQFKYIQHITKIKSEENK